ncbi:hypothetical protein AGOR_G00100570 [Albula goreensis]|uniref:Centriole, cilia and spindle-associated protein n=1 Tax=Albula goreensis TaxID=1534307 RepID=A0A8T3DNQ8_9TELE|nr:hypothetical protein AGOR_G00100570 [Albula goreensis]
MVTKKIRTEYMKKFKDPKWETYSKCYEDSLKYRLTRRLLEHAHKPWSWEGWDSGSESSGRSTPKSKSKIQPLKLKENTLHDSENEACEQEQESMPKDSSEPPACPEIADPQRSAGTTHPLPLTDSVENGETTEEDEEPGKGVRHTVRLPATRSEPDCNTCLPPNTRPPRKPVRAKSQPPQEPAQKQDQGGRHRPPFSLYGWAGSEVETALKKTHNVCSSAPAKEIHPSALRAKTRRDAEKRGRALERRRARSADLEKAHRTRLDPTDDPWMTEYMRCFSARSR